jgi:hypothetical protein
MATVGAEVQVEFITITYDIVQYSTVASPGKHLKGVE